MFLAVDNPTSSELTRRTLGWTPTGPGLLASLDQPDNFPVQGTVAPAGSRTAG